MRDIIFECTRLKGTNKVGIIKPDRDGCYTQVIGALGAYNSAGSFYDLESGVRFFQAQSSFQRKIGRGVLRAETGHPKRLPGMKEYEYGSRILHIEETLVCGTWRRIWLSREDLRDDQGRRIIPIMGTIYPSGPYRDMLIHAYASPGEQVCYSIRSFTNDTPRGDGTYLKRLLQIVTFDYVTEPGMWNAEKLLSPNLEGYRESNLRSDPAARSLGSSQGNAEKLLSPNLEHNSADRALLSETLVKSRGRESVLLSPTVSTSSLETYSTFAPETLYSIMADSTGISIESSTYDSDFAEQLLKIIHTESKNPSYTHMDW